MIVQPKTCNRLAGPGALSRVWDTPEMEFSGKDTVALAYDAARFVKYVGMRINEITSKWLIQHGVRLI